MDSQENADYEGGVGRLREAYDSLGYELVEVHDNLTVPSASPAFFEYDGSPCVTDAVEIENRFNECEYAFIDVFAQNGEAWYEFAVDATVFGPDGRDRAKLKVSTSGVSIFQDREEKPSEEFFNELVTTTEDAVKTDLVWRGDDG